MLNGNRLTGYQFTCSKTRSQSEKPVIGKFFIILLCTYILIILLTLTDRKINNPAPRQPFAQHSNVSYSYSYMLIRRSWQVVTSPAVNHSSPVGRCGRVRRIPARAQTALYRNNIARSTADDAGKTDAMLMPGGRHFGFRYSLSTSSGIVMQESDYHSHLVT